MRVDPNAAADAMHERTNRCLGLGYGSGESDHTACARIEIQHTSGDHSECLIWEDGFSRADVERAQRYLDSPGYDGAATTVEEYLRAQMDEPEECDGRCEDGRQVCTLWHGPRPGEVEGEVEAEVLADVLARALHRGKADVVTTSNGRWWLTMDLFSISRFERDVIERVAARR